MGPGYWWGFDCRDEEGICWGCREGRWLAKIESSWSSRYDMVLFAACLFELWACSIVVIVSCEKSGSEPSCWIERKCYEPFL